MKALNEKTWKKRGRHEGRRDRVDGLLRARQELEAIINDCTSHANTTIVDSSELSPPQQRAAAGRARERHASTEEAVAAAKRCFTVFTEAYTLSSRRRRVLSADESRPLAQPEHQASEQ